MRLFLTFLIQLFLTGNANGQFLPFQDKDALIAPSFDYNIIRSRHISCITLHRFIKPNDLPVNDEGVIIKYYFDSAGMLYETLKINHAVNENWDTGFTYYYYGKNGLLKIKRTGEDGFFDSCYYTWDDKGRLNKETHGHECDSFAYISYPKQLQQYTYNDENKIYKKTIIQYDDYKRLLSRSCHYTVGSLFSEVDFSYDSLQRMNRYEVKGNINGDMNNTTLLNYDSTGALSNEELWSHGIKTRRIEFLYDKKTKLISNELDMETATELIYIIKFEYNFY